MYHQHKNPLERQRPQEAADVELSQKSVFGAHPQLAGWELGAFETPQPGRPLKPRANSEV